MKKALPWWILPVLLLFSCAGIPKQALREVDPSITFQGLRADPGRYVGKTVVLGGQIALTTVQGQETWMEVVQHPLDWQHHPKETDESYGRFLIHFSDFRDPAIYAAGRRITVVGKVEGAKARMLQQIEYIYPVVQGGETYLWDFPQNRGPFLHLGIGVGGVFH